MNRVNDQCLLDDMLHHQALPLPLVKQAASEILALIREGLKRDGVVNVSNFGSFRLKPVASRRGINPKTREAITIPAHQRVVFTPCKALRELIDPDHQPPIPIQPDVKQPQNELPSVAMASIALAAKPVHVLGTPVDSANSTSQSASHLAGDASQNTESTSSQPAVSEEAHYMSGAGRVAETGDNNEVPGEESPRGARIDNTLSLDLGRFEADDNAGHKRKYALAAALIVILALGAAAMLLDFDGQGTDTPSTIVAGAATTAGAESNVPLPADKSQVLPVKAQGTTTSGINQSDHGAGNYFNEQRQDVNNGDNLWRLAETHYHEPLLWPHIFQANKDTITDPDRVIEGATLLIPTLQGGPDALTAEDRRNIAEGYYLAYMHYKRSGREDAIFALLMAKHYDESIMRRHQGKVVLSLAR